MPTATAVRKFTDEDAYKTWRVQAMNPDYKDTTEGFGFSNGWAVVPGLPKRVVCTGECSPETVDDDCRLHTRKLHLNNLLSYTRYVRVADPNKRNGRLEKRDGYRVFSEEEYEREFEGGDEDEALPDMTDI